MWFSADLGPRTRSWLDVKVCRCYILWTKAPYLLTEDQRQLLPERLRIRVDRSSCRERLVDYQNCRIVSVALHLPNLGGLLAFFEFGLSVNKTIRLYEKVLLSVEVCYT